LTRASSIKLQAASCDVVAHMKVKIFLIKNNIAFIANAAQDGRQLKLDEARRRYVNRDPASYRTDLSINRKDI
jgi:hypothetical protein